MEIIPSGSYSIAKNFTIAVDYKQTVQLNQIMNLLSSKWGCHESVFLFFVRQVGNKVFFLEIKYSSDIG
ncbi:hypothetical protein EDC35_103287 [Thiobaca trueperi]|uniref:Uncharacterized protein n=1 Tax=Thiobaca trueperi TaxID=127458 RepID=A0A4R3MZQ0_9GAMM|nr:hypothetical protein EDC35_103287 [Thiobaca trueperi]